MTLVRACASRALGLHRGHQPGVEQASAKEHQMKRFQAHRFALAGLLALCGCHKVQEVSSSWAATPPEIDGRPTEWTELPLNPLVEGM